MIKVKDLVDIGDKDYAKRRSEFFYCPFHGRQSYGGTRGDYFMQSPDFEFKCEVSSCELFLATAMEVIKIKKREGK